MKIQDLGQRIRVAGRRVGRGWMAAALLATATAHAAAVQYRIVSFEDGVRPAALNNHGTVLTYLQDSAGQSIGAGLWSVSTGNVPIPGFPAAGLAALNDRGEVLANTYIHGEARAAIWSPQGGMKYYGVDSAGLALNNKGESLLALGYDGRKGFQIGSADGTTRQLAPFTGVYGSSVWSGGINAAGHAVVGFNELDSVQRSVVWGGDSIAVDLGDGFHANGITDDDTVYGFVDTPSLPMTAATLKVTCTPHCAVGPVKPLGHLYEGTAEPPHSRARDMNAHGAVVGLSDTKDDVSAFLWTEADGMLDLNSLIAPDDPLRSKVHLYSAEQINDDGWILAASMRLGSWEPSKTYLLVPSPVPEVDATALGVAGLLPIWWMRRRSRAGSGSGADGVPA